MVWRVVENNQIKPVGGNPGASPNRTPNSDWSSIGIDTMKKIPLTQNRFALVDDEDFERLSRHKWCAVCHSGIYYAMREQHLSGSGKNRKRKTILMHRLIMNAKKEQQIDHRNGSGLDNRKQNLRFCTQSQNNMNQKPSQSSTSSRFKGVSWKKENKKWVAYITKSRQRHHVGYFNSEIEAAEAYDKRAKELFGEFARTNF